MVSRQEIEISKFEYSDLPKLDVVIQKRYWLSKVLEELHADSKIKHEYIVSAWDQDDEVYDLFKAIRNYKRLNI